MSDAQAAPDRARRYAAPLVALALALVLWEVSRTGVPPHWAFAAHRAVTRTMAQEKIPGLSVAVCVNGSLRWSAGYGFSDVENRIPARPETVYRWASVSKPVTAVAVMQLVERGAIDLDAPIQAYVPTFPVKPWPVTVRQLLSHLGGVRHYKRAERASTHHYGHFREAFPTFQEDPLVCEPGTRHVYTTYGYNLLGAAVEGASGRSYMDFLRANVFGPAGMRSTGKTDLEALIPHRTRGYVKSRDGGWSNARPVDFSNRTPGGGLCGTAEDAARFGAAVLAGRLVRPETFAAMSTRQKTRDGRRIDYGLGWGVGRRGGRDEVSHAGHSAGTSTLLFLIPERKLSVALMTNLEGAHLADLAHEIADAAAP